MRHSRLIFALVVVGTFFGASFACQAQVQDAQTNADLRCLVVGLRFAGSPAAKLKRAGLIETLYYLGRLDARAPHLDLETLIGGLAAKMTASDFRSEAKRCGTLLAARGQALQKMGRDLEMHSKH